MESINWLDIKNPKMLVDFLESFLVRVFTPSLLENEAQKLEKFVSRGRPEALMFLKSINVHRAAKWYKLLHEIKGQGYSFDLRFSSNVEEFMKLTLFAYAMNILIEHNILQTNRSDVVGRLRDREGFESLMYEVMVASNYASRRFDVSFPEFYGKRIDVYAKKGEVEVYAECKTLKRNEKYVDVAVEVGSWLNEKKINILLDVTLSKTPKGVNEVGKVCSIVKRAVEEGKQLKEEYVDVSFTKLPEHLNAPLPLHIRNPENIEFILSSSYTRFSEVGLEVKDPKVIIFRNPNKSNEVIKRLKDLLEKAHSQLETAEGGRKIIYVDVSEVVGKPILQLPALINLVTGPELIFSKIEEFTRSWLETHAKVDSIILTEPKLYITPLGIPYALTIEQKIICPYISPGWTILMNVLPVPKISSPSHLVNMGIELAKRGYRELAIEYYRKAIEIDPKLKEAYNNLGKLLTEIGHPHVALDYLDKVLELYPNYVSALINKGIALSHIGRYDEALEFFNKAISLAPNNEKAFYNKALLYYGLNRLKEAYENVIIALKINPNYESALKLKLTLEKFSSCN